jgi:glycosyltransferase involved in cell wall biosynthesis
MSVEANSPIGSNVEKEPRLRVLMSAYTCTPGLPSEPGVGWHNIVQAARFHNVTVVTSEGNRASIEAELSERPIPNVEWHYVSLPGWLSWYLTGDKGGRVHYYLYQIAAYQVAKRLHARMPFDIIHHVNYVSYWTPVFLSRLDAPFIWGPVGGAESIPRGFYKTLNLRSIAFERLRDSVRWIAHHLDPFVRETARNAAFSLATTEESAAKMRALGADPVDVLPAICMSDDDLDQLLKLPARSPRKHIQFISIGRLLGWKGYHLSLHAFARFHRDYPRSRYVIVGRGPQMEALQHLAVRLNIMQAVIFTGFIPHADVMKRLAESDVLVHPSLHDSGGVTCLEAMAAGRPVLCLNTGGPAVLVNERTGIVASVNSPEDAIRELAAGMHQFADSPEVRQQMGWQGQQHVLENYTWAKRGLYLRDLYARVNVPV